MKNNQYSTLAKAIQGLKKRGFDAEFKLENEDMKCIGNDRVYHPDDMRIVEFHRFEGLSDPGDMSVIFAVRCNDGAAGTIVSAYGPYASMALVTFMDKVKIVEQEKLAA